MDERTDELKEGWINEQMDRRWIYRLMGGWADGRTCDADDGGGSGVVSSLDLPVDVSA